MVCSRIVFSLSKSAEEYSIHSVSLDGDEFGIVGASPTIKLVTRPANILYYISVLVQKAFKYRFFPSDSQAEQIRRTFGCARFVYNQALDFRSNACCRRRNHSAITTLH